MVRVIKNEKEYEIALADIKGLMDRDPDVGTPEAEQLELLSLVIEDYEKRMYPIAAPDPVEAIRFRMEQQGLIQRDLAPYIGSPSKVSEVLSRKRPLTLSMIKALHSGLGIPAKSLLGEPESSDENGEIEWHRFPVKEMAKRGWIKSTSAVRHEAERLLSQFFKPIGLPNELAALYKGTKGVRASRSMDKYSLAAWTARIMILALQDPPPVEYQAGSITIEFMRDVAQLSWSEMGPRLAQEFLRKHGIPLIIEPHLPQTHLDGAAIMVWVERPIIGLTLRHDRIDNFWFCLMHELAHISLHYGQGFTHFYDDLDLKTSDDPREREADALAGEALIPEAEWKKSPAKSLRSKEAALHLANRLRIHPAIVAGRMRHEFGSYTFLNQMIGQGKVRPCFPDVSWSW
jgi:HTH-type transcriptional regulator/antitoxin HigA